MEKKLKCLRCGHEYIAASKEAAEQQERTCPRCRSNSVRLLPEDKKPKD